MKKKNITMSAIVVALLTGAPELASAGVSVCAGPNPPRLCKGKFLTHEEFRALQRKSRLVHFHLEPTQNYTNPVTTPIQKRRQQYRQMKK